MAEKRMFTKKITDSDAFQNMPLSAQALYFHLNMAADDEGFVNNPMKIQRCIGAAIDDLNILVAKNFIIRYESGIIVIKHWKMHNYIAKDRFHKTDYTEERAMLEVKENGAYTLADNALYTECIQIEDRDKNSIDKNSIDKVEEEPKRKRFVPPTLEEVQAYCKGRNNNVDAKKFFDYYEQGGWKDSKGNPVKNWKQKLITWENKEPKTEQKKHFGNERTNIDFEALKKSRVCN